MTRVRGFTQDDAHIFCAQEQLLDEFIKVIDLVLYVFKSLGFEDFTAQISLRDQEKMEKYIGSEKVWNLAEKAILDAAKSKNLNYRIDFNNNKKILNIFGNIFDSNYEYKYVIDYQDPNLQQATLELKNPKE